MVGTASLGAVPTFSEVSFLFLNISLIFCAAIMKVVWVALIAKGRHFSTLFLSSVMALNRRNFVKRAAAASMTGMALPDLISAPPQAKRSLRIAHITDMHLDTRAIAGVNVK